MKVAFIENRYKTYFWSALANELRLEGFSISWLVQNPLFTPPAGNVYKIPFPSKKELRESVALNSPVLNWISSTDRFINYFGGSSKHYTYYNRRIKEWLDSESPDYVVGESTLFHELMVIEECRARGIPFFHPTLPGYPGGRFSVYTYSGKEPVCNGVLNLHDEKLLSFAEDVRKRKKVPQYMIPPTGMGKERAFPMPGSLLDRATILRGYLMGERFNTPAPWKKWVLDKRIRRFIANWDEVAVAIDSLKDQKYILYAMQMQPEANLDVWGNKFRDQEKLINDISDSLPEGWHLLVKANPKFRFEVSESLFYALRYRSNVSAVSRFAPMSELLDKVDIVCTVTGTIAVECVLSQKPVIQFGPGIPAKEKGCVQVNEVSEIKEVIGDLESGRFEIASDEDRVSLVKRLFKTTFPGIVSDPVNLPEVMNPDNVKKVAEGIIRVIDSYVSS